MNKFNLKIILLQGAKHQHNMTMTRTMTMTAPLFKLGTILLLLRIDPTAALFSIELKPGTIECFTIQTPIDNHATLSGNYDCLNDELEGGVVNAWIEEAKPEGAMLWHGDDEASEGLYSLKTEPNTRLRLCFDAVAGELDDAVTQGTTIPVGFNMRLVPDPRSLPDQEIGPDAERALLQVQAAFRIQSDWGNLQDHYVFLRTRESINEALTDAIMNKVMGWTIAEACLVVGMAIAQVMYWRKFFEQRRYL